jgi:hypothetical protein
MPKGPESEPEEDMPTYICCCSIVSVFYCLPTEGYTRGGKFRCGDAEIKNSKMQGTQDLDRFGLQGA